MDPDLRYREMTEPDFPRLPVKWEGGELHAYVKRREALGDLTVGWAEVYDHNTGAVVMRYERECAILKP